jgi:hypothetical protein
MDYSVDTEHPVKGVSGITTEYATAALVIGCLIALILIRRGFRGVGIPGVGGVKLG